MWTDYQSSYRDVLQDPAFLKWREVGARRKAANIVRVCRGITVHSVLEVGCGTGAVLRELEHLRFAGAYTASDVSLDAIRFAQKSCSGFLRGAFVGQAGYLPFEDRAFSVAVLSHVIEHLENPFSAVREASRVAEFVVIEVPTEQVLSNQIRANVLGKPYASAADAGHVQFWSPSSIEAFLTRSCGMQIVVRHRDLLGQETEFYGKAGFKLAKPIMKQTLKSLLPGMVYARLLTTHATFLCRRPDVGHQKSIAPTAAMECAAS
jgi:SAM-dependent methyltransferase